MAPNEVSEFKEILKDMQKDIRGLADRVIELSTLYKHHDEMSSANSRRIDQLETEVATAKGSISIIKVLGSSVSVILLTSGISFCTWIVSANAQLKDKISTTNKDIAVLNYQIIELKKHDDKEKANEP